MIIPEIKMSEAKKGKSFEYYLKKVKPYPIITINTSSLFGGNIDMLKRARKKYPKKMIIRKDFMMIPKQIDESIKAGADYVLLLYEYLTKEQLELLKGYCYRKDIGCIIETVSYHPLLKFSDKILINSRNLNTGIIDKNKSINICKRYKNYDSLIYASGENSNNVSDKGIAFYVLIGTAFMKEKLK
jgi:indole-3-glycerol phosphate synthase